MTRTDMIAIRRRLRDVNIEYSGLVRNKLGASRRAHGRAEGRARDPWSSLIVQNEKSGPLAVSTVIAPETSRHVAL